MANDSEQQLPLFRPVTSAPNGERVTQAVLYKALHEMDVAYTNRFNVIFEAINDRSDEMIQLSKRVTRHEDVHPGESAKKRYGMMAPLITGISIAVAAVITTIKEVLFS